MGKSKLSLLGIKAMQLIINAPEGNQFTIEAESNWTVAQLKEQVCLETGIKFNQQNLIVGGKPLNEKVALADFGLENDSAVELLKKYNHDKKICRKCYATLPPRAEKCRKRSCGHWPDIRPRKTIKQK